MKKVAIIPPNGKMKYQDFFIYRISDFFIENNIEIEIITLFDNNEEEEPLPVKLKSFDNLDNLIAYINTSNFDLTIHRCWMHGYMFATNFLNKINTNLVFYIKDWFVEIPREEYKFLYKTDDDYDGIRLLFESGNKILSHFTPSYIENVWTKKYNIDTKNFIFFPEYSSKKKYIDKGEVNYDISKLKFVLQGTVGPTSFPSAISNQRLILNDIKRITAQKIYFDRMVLEKTYNNVMESPLYLDYKYEHLFNPYFKLIKGKPFNAIDTLEYHYAVYQLLDTSKFNSKEALPTLNSVVSKFTNYLEAGLPIIINQDYEYVSTLVKKYNLGFVISNKEVNNLKTRLDISQKDYNTMINNVKQFRMKYSYSLNTMKTILELINE